MKVNRILLIDDDLLTNRANKRSLENMEVFTYIDPVSSGKEALELLKTCSMKSHLPDSIPDLILLDVKMPNMDGFEFIEHFDRLPSRGVHKVVICMLTSSINTKFRIQGHSNKSIHAYLYKPLDTNELLSIIREHQPASVM